MKDSGYSVLYQCNAIISPHKTGDGLVDMKCGNLQCQPGRCSRCGSTSSIGVFDPNQKNIKKDKYLKRARERIPTAPKS